VEEVAYIKGVGCYSIWTRESLEPGAHHVGWDRRGDDVPGSRHWVGIFERSLDFFFEVTGVGTGLGMLSFLAMCFFLLKRAGGALGHGLGDFWTGANARKNLLLV
jgi:hypothetical protein